jgi:hypothetical protein
VERIAETDLSSEDGPRGLDKMCAKEYCPPEIVVELAKCVLGMLHYRVLSWAQFRTLLKRRHVLGHELRAYDPELIDTDAQNQLTDFRMRFSLDLNQSTFRKLPPHL